MSQLRLAVVQSYLEHYQALPNVSRHVVQCALLKHL